jgi:hypothetical protein
LPTEARVFIQAQRKGPRNIIYGVTPEFAMSLMDDVDHPELVLYCEDEKAQTLVDALISQEMPEIRNRVAVIPVGAASTVKTLGQLASADKLANPSLGVLDGNEMQSEGCILLPGNQAPEREVFHALDEPAWEKVAHRLDVRVGDLLEAIDDARQIDNHHAWIRKVAERLGPRIRVGRVWEDAASVWSKEVVDPAQRTAFVESVFERLTK